MKSATCSKYSRTILKHQKHMEYIDRKIDERSENGKSNEDCMSEHYVGCSDDGSRVWSF